MSLKEERKRVFKRHNRKEIKEKIGKEKEE